MITEYFNPHKPRTFDEIINVSVLTTSPTITQIVYIEDYMIDNVLYSMYYDINHMGSVDHIYATPSFNEIVSTGVSLYKYKQSDNSLLDMLYLADTANLKLPSDTFKKMLELSNMIVFSSSASINPFIINLPLNSHIQLFNLLSARYGNSQISNEDEMKFISKLASTTFQYAPSWIKKLEIQQSVRQLTESDILTGAKQISSHAYNPSNVPSNQIIDTINEQNQLDYKKGKIDAYSSQWDLIVSDVTESFLNHYKTLFINILRNKCYNDFIHI